MEKYGYPIETHHVITEDGYNLTVHRIPNERIANFSERKPPVLIQHGLGSCSVDWVIRANLSIGLLLADSGWDVWIGNNRGTTDSRKHVNLNPDKDKKFWDYR